MGIYAVLRRTETQEGASARIGGPRLNLGRWPRGAGSSCGRERSTGPLPRSGLERAMPRRSDPDHLCGALAHCASILLVAERGTASSGTAREYVTLHDFCSYHACDAHPPGNIRKQLLEAKLSGTAQVFAHEAHLRSILETVPDAMIVIDSLGCI